MCNSIRSSPSPTSPGPSEQGMALPGVLLLAAFLVSVTGWLVGHTRTDVSLRAALEESHRATHVAEAALQSVAMSLQAVPDWTAVDALAAALVCPPAPAAVAALDEPEELAWLQREVAATSRWGADTPTWQPVWACHAAAVLGRWPDLGAIPSVAVWVADEPEGDRQPLRSTNQRLLLTAVARVGAGARGEATATLVRAGPGAAVELDAWRVAGGS